VQRVKVVTVIPARGGSKSIPKKNIQKLAGRPLISYSIEYSLKSDLVSATIVSTDSNDISAIASDEGAEVPFLRPAELATDESVDYEFMRHALEFFEAEGRFYDVYVLLRPTSPLRPPGLIERAMDLLKANPSATSVRSVTTVKEHPFRMWTVGPSGEMHGFVRDVREPYNMPRQALPTLYFQTGDIELVRRDTLKSGSVSGDNVCALVINHDEMVDIDSWQDLEKAGIKICEVAG
jgi:N-acylneuraminate cytidylyltransferase